MEYVIESKELLKNYGKAKVLKGLNLHVPNGSIYGLVGNNGTGKSTFMRVLCGLQEPSGGEFSIYGVKNSDKKGILKARSRIGAVIEVPSMYLEMSARDNLKQQFRILGIPSFEGVDEILKSVGLADTGKKAAKNFSLGMKQRLGLGMALAGNPDCIVLDEPMNGLDPEGVIEMRETILKLNKEKNITFIISSHILDELSKVATHYGFIEDGKIVVETSADDMYKEGRKVTTIVVSDSNLLVKILEKKSAEYEVENETTVKVYGDFDINDSLQEMLDNGIKLNSFNTTNQSLESYYLDLLSTGKKEAK